MRTLSRILLLLVAVAVGAFLVVRGVSALHASVPRNMPPDAQFVSSGFNLNNNEQTGQWISCKQSTASRQPFCRLTNASGSVLYQGDFEPLDGRESVAAEELRLTGNPGNLWVNGPAEGSPVPVIPLKNGRVLVPVQDREALIDRWTQNPEELREISGS